MSLNWLPVIGKIVGGVTDIIDQKVEDKDLANQLKAELSKQAMSMDMSELDAQKSIIVAEAESGNVLTSSWRPLTMLCLVGCVMAHWLGFTPPNLPNEQVLALLDIVQVGLGGYVIGRSAEKVAKVWKA